jgi:hypothetical protein
MRIIGTFFMFLFFFSGLSFAQITEYKQLKRNGIYTEVYLIRHDFSGGPVSFNYEWNFGKKRKAYLRAGIYPDFESAVSFPLIISWITHPLSRHHFEYGVGLVFRVEHFVDPQGINTREWFYDVPAIQFPVMYRYQRASGLYFRAGVNVWVSWPTLPAPSVSLGYRF